MGEPQVRIVRLSPMRVASAIGFGESPEVEAWRKLLSWAETKGLPDPAARFFGFNNPDPSPGSPNYGYEQWMSVPAGVAAGEAIGIKEFPGGLYAIARCQGALNIAAAWKQFGEWLATSPHSLGQHQWLEECLTPPRSWAEFQGLSPDALVMDLYLPIAD